MLFNFGVFISYIVCKVWISALLCFGSNATEKMLFLEIRIQHIKIPYPYSFKRSKPVLVRIMFYTRLLFNFIAFRCPAAQPTPECSDEQRALLAGDEYCGFLNPDRISHTPFADCISYDYQQAKEKYEACITDVCVNLGRPYEEKAKCDVVAGMAQYCTDSGLSYNNWRSDSFCRKYSLWYFCFCRFVLIC